MHSLPIIALYRMTNLLHCLNKRLASCARKRGSGPVDFSVCWRSALIIIFTPVRQYLGLFRDRLANIKIVRWGVRISEDTVTNNGQWRGQTLLPNFEIH